MRLLLPLLFLIFLNSQVRAQSFNARPEGTQKPVLHGRHWMAITGKPLAATAGATIFNKGGNAVDAACAMLAATCTMWDVLSWGGETQALIYNPKTGKVIGINALGVAPTGATPAFFKGKGMNYPPEYGPLAATTPGTPGGLCTMLAEFGTLSLKEVLTPAMTLAEGYPIEAQTANAMERGKDRIKQWPYSRSVFLPHPGEAREAPAAGEIFVQKDLLETLKKMVDTEQQALKKGKSRKEAIYAAMERFYKGDIAQEFVRGAQEQGGLITANDLATWKVKMEEPMKVNYKGIDVYKLSQWTQGPVMLQALNMLENIDLKSMGYNSARYIHTLYQVMNLSFADRDFYYGDPATAPEEPMKGLLSKDYARERVKAINPTRNDPAAGPGDPYPFEGKVNPYTAYLKQWGHASVDKQTNPLSEEAFLYQFRLGTTSVEAADKEGWVVSITPSGGWLPACIAGKTGVGMSQRMQSFVTDPRLNPFNVVAPGKQPRVTLTPTLAMKEGKPFLSFAVQGGDTQDQNLLQFFLNIVEFGMNVQEAAEAANINSYQMYASLGGEDRKPVSGGILLQSATPEWVRKELFNMGYRLSFDERTSGPINAIYFDWAHGSFWADRAITVKTTALAGSTDRNTKILYKQMLRMKIVNNPTLWLCALMAVTGYTFGQTATVPSKEAQIKAAVLAAPEAQREKALIYGYNDKGEFVVLRTGSNEMVCLADDPAQPGLNASCYQKDLDPFMARGRELKKSGKSFQEIFDIRETEVKSGKLAMPKQPATLYVFSATAEEFNAATGDVTGGNLRYVIYIPYATAESTGLPLKPEAPGMPWIMDPGTHRAHIMITPPPKNSYVAHVFPLPASDKGKQPL